MSHKYAEILRAIADNPEVEVEVYTNGEWVKAEAPLISIQSNRNLRLKPATVKIGTFDVPAPLTEPKDKVYRVYIHVSYEAGRNLVTGLEHPTQEASLLHAKDLRSLTKPE